MRPGTLVRLPDGREGRVVYHGLDGYGIKFGRDPVDVAQIRRGNCINGHPDGYSYEWNPEAMLREPYPSAEVECVGRDYEIVKEGV